VEEYAIRPPINTFAKKLSINLWRLPNVSVVIGNEIEIPKWEFLLFAETRLCSLILKV
jgi:hypothetical protein